MTGTLGASVELLERALGYTRLRLAEVDASLLDRPTPCAGWDLADLLAHMEDALDAFTEAAGGEVSAPVRRPPGSTATICDKACALLGVWARPAPGDVLVGDRELTSSLLVATAALEVTVHGWDVGQSTGSGVPVPPLLAADLLPVAHLTVTRHDRGVRFADPRPGRPGEPADVRLLDFLGRSGLVQSG
ncbi:TIGR03086 family metal-binding protein [Nocardioides mangrovi]|uniref:TIGR03086 family protein n=1 Tax=Nocardioides mangrovi TaxID=2874580 RepID=A0ABS7UAQ3_9ACTN|nr:TIGR03086 family metal-binding protein [Nocardioides mangrovi]MBZ5738078.1 TIGR03086 family protein [Nocardioides mangrovi]